MSSKLHLILGLSAILGLAAVSPGNAEPVRVGGPADFDACGVVGVPKGLNPRGDNFLAVRAGPSSRTRMRAKLRPGQRFFICETRGQWVGIVYGRGGSGVTSPIRRRQAYRGPCRSGWVFRRFVRVIAG